LVLAAGNFRLKICLSTLSAFIVLFIFGSCSSSNKVAFGNRRFYPDHATKKSPFVKSQENSEGIVTTIFSQECDTVQSSDDLVSSFRHESRNVKKRSIRRQWQKLKSVLVVNTLLRQSKISASSESLFFQSVDQEKRTLPPGAAGAIFGFLFGLLSLFIFPLIFGITGLIFSAVALSKDNKGNLKGLAIIGLILSLIGVVGAFLILAHV